MDSLKEINPKPLSAKSGGSRLSVGLAQKYFFYIFTPVLLVVVIAGMAVFYQNIYHAQAKIVDRETTKINEARISLREALNSALTDLSFLIRDENLVGYVREPGEAQRKRLERTFISFSGAKKVFDQVRFIDVTGKEQVRVDLVNRVPTGAPASMLQNKKQRYYFSEAIDLPAGQVFISRLDLNIEGKMVEIPYKPMIRLVAPVDVDGKRYGVVVLNYLADNFISHVRRTFSSEKSDGFLTNADGYWLLGPTHDVEWAFMFGRADRLQDLYPEAWAGVSDQPAQVMTSQNIFTVAKLPAPPHAAITDHSDPYWVLVSRVPLSAWYIKQFSEYVPEAAVMTLMLIILGFGSWRIATTRATREQMDGLYHRRLVDALNESERRNTAVVEASDDVVMMCSQSGYIRHANQAAERVFNVPQVDLVGREISEFLMDPDTRSEERRVGKECRTRWSPDH